MDERVLSALRAALLALDDPAVLKTFKTEGLVAASPQDYDLIRQGMAAAARFENESPVSD